MATPREILHQAKSRPVSAAPSAPTPAPVPAPAPRRILSPQPIRAHSVYRRLMEDHDRMRTQHLRSPNG